MRLYHCLLVQILLLPSAMAQQTTVRGTAVDATTGTPLDGVVISLEGEMAEQGQHRGTTGPKGTFSFEEVKPGRFVLRAVLTGYQMIEPEGYVHAGPGGLAPLSVKLVKMAAIAGIVQDDEENPIVACSVELLELRELGDYPQLRPVASATTAKDGTFSFKDVVPGKYYVQASPAVSKSSSRRTEFIPTYYPAATDAAAAAPLTVYPAADLVGLRLKLRKSVLYRVSGKVEGFRVPARLRLIIMPAAAQGSDVPGGLLNPRLPGPSASVGPDGSFSVEGVPPGWYVAVAVDDESGSIRANTGFVVKALDIENLRVIVAPGATFAGRVVYDGESSGPVPRQFRLTSFGPSGYRMVSLDVSADGRFETHDVPAGRYRLVVSDPAWSVLRVQHGPATTTGASVDLTSSASDAVVITLTTKGITLTGRIEGDFRSDAPAVGIVTIVPHPTTMAEMPSLRTVSLNATGTFAVQNLSPGDYRVCAWKEAGRKPAELLAYSAVQQRLDSACVAVTLKTGEPQNVTLKQISVAEIER